MRYIITKERDWWGTSLPKREIDEVHHYQRERLMTYIITKERDWWGISSIKREIDEVHHHQRERLTRYIITQERDWWSTPSIESSMTTMRDSNINCERSTRYNTSSDWFNARGTRVVLNRSMQWLVLYFGKAPTIFHSWQHRVPLNWGYFRTLTMNHI